MANAFESNGPPDGLVLTVCILACGVIVLIPTLPVCARLLDKDKNQTRKNRIQFFIGLILIHYKMKNRIDQYISRGPGPYNKFTSVIYGRNKPGTGTHGDRKSVV